MLTPDDLLVVIPAYNEAAHLPSLLRQVRSEGFNNVLVVSDGSVDDTVIIAENEGAIVLDHILNRGPGSATATGLEYALQSGYKAAITIDADLQHDADDIIHLLNRYNQSGADVIIGSRFLDPSNKIPGIRRLYNSVANLITFLFCFEWTGDTQSGFKFLSRRALETIKINLDGYEFCSEMLIKAYRSGLRVEEISVKVYYTEESLSKGQGFINGLKTFYNLLLSFLVKG